MQQCLPSSKLPAISASVINACDAKDSLKDSILNDPRSCHYDPKILLCKSADPEACLAAPQIKTLQTL